MSYTAISIDVFIAAYAGCLGGMRSLRNVSQNTDPGHYTHLCNVALAFAEAFDTEYASPLPNDLQIAEIEAICSEQMNGRQPGGSGPTTAAFWTKPVRAIIALLSEADSIVAANVTNPIPFPSPPAGIPVIQIATVTGVADSLKSTIPATNIVAMVDGYYTKGDEGGGPFYWLTTSTATDDGGSVINPTGHVGTGRWIRIISGNLLSVRWWGAKGDGVTNDLPACQAAVQYCVAQAGTVTWTGNGTSSFFAHNAPTVFFPSGRYAFGRSSPTPGTPGYNNGLEVPGNLTIEGQGDSTIFLPLAAVGNTTALVRCANTLNTIRDITFVNGNVAIALYGLSANYGLIGDPAGGEQNTNVYERCRFYTQRGVSVWQDTTPISNPQNNRSIQPPVIFRDCLFEGPSAFWGVTDFELFDGCNFVWDQSNITPELTSDGFPLGMINNCDHTLLINCTISPNASATGSPPWPIGNCIYVGSGLLYLDHVIHFDLGACWIRDTLSPTYQGLAEAAVPLPSDPATALVLTADGSFFNCVAKNFIEFYSNVPFQIYVVGCFQLVQDACYGIFFNSGVNLTDAIERHGVDLTIEIDQYLSNFRRMRQGADPTDPVLTDVSDVFTAYYINRVGENEATPFVANNLFLQGVYTTTNGGGAGTVSTSGNDFTGTGNDTTTGYTIQKNTSTASTAAFKFTTPAVLVGMPAGVYVFSIWIKADFSNNVQFGYTINGKGRSVTPKKFNASGTEFQQLEFPFYFDGSSTYLLQGTIFGIPNGATWSVGLFGIHHGVHAAPYLAPVNTPTAATTNVTTTRHVGTYYGGAPANGSQFIKGDLVLNDDPDISEFIGLVCTTAGTVGSGAILTKFGFINNFPPGALDKTTTIAFLLGGVEYWTLDATNTLHINGGNFVILSSGQIVLRAAAGQASFYDATINHLRNQSGSKTFAETRDTGTAADGWWFNNYSTTSVNNVAAPGDIGTAAATIDQFNTIFVEQTTGGALALTLPAPTITTPSKIAIVGCGSSATQAFSMYGVTLNPPPSANYATFFWNGTAWSHLS